jgi:hypothetical protein
MVCFFLFLFFAILQEKGQLGSYLQELSIDARSRIERHLAVRENMIQELAIHLERSVNTIEKIVIPYETAPSDILAYLQYTIKKLLFTYTVLQAKYFLSPTESRTQSLSLQIRFYSTHESFVNKSYNLVHSSSEVKSSTGGGDLSPRLTKLKVLDV